MKLSKITVVDYRTSNLLSITKALENVGAEVKLTQNAADIAAAERLVLPGVGAFGAAMRNIESLGIREALVTFGKSGRPLIGICLGMQLLFGVSYELGTNKGLALIDGEVVEFPDKPPLKVPHMGWNQIQFKRNSRLFSGVHDKEYAYFVHSYYVRTSDNYVSGATEYGVTFPSIVEDGNIFGIQFHPEKSQSFGLRILETFLRV
jgi:glutamine amidotransferase